MLVKVLNLNLWNYNNFNRRKPKIVQLIKKYDPDIVTFEEVRNDSRKNKPGDNQLKQLNRLLKYPYECFIETMDVNSVNKALKDPAHDPSNPKVKEGLGLLSKFKILKHIKKKLRQHSKDKYTRAILAAQLEIWKQKINIFVVHYSANDLFSMLHLKETINYAERKRIKPIILGDFNIRKASILHDLASSDYLISSEIYKYKSFGQIWTLDYILVPRSYRFESFECIKTKVSDHKALFCKFEI